MVFFNNFFLIIFLFSIFLYNPKISKKFFVTFLSILFSASLIYFFKGNKEAFVFENLVSKEINKITNNPESLKEINPQKIIFSESKLRENPMDLEGWKLLARTCLMTGHIQKAEVTLYKSSKIFSFKWKFNIWVCSFKKKYRSITMVHLNF